MAGGEGGNGNIVKICCAILSAISSFLSPPGIIPFLNNVVIAL